MMEFFLRDGIREEKMNGGFDLAGHFYILLTLLFTVYGQLVLKWQMGQADSMLERGTTKYCFCFSSFSNLGSFPGYLPPSYTFVSTDNAFALRGGVPVLWSPETGSARS